MLPLALLLGLGMHVAWRRMSGPVIRRKLRLPALAALVVGLVGPIVIYGSSSVLTVVGVTIGVWVFLSALVDPFLKFRDGGGLALMRGHWAMVIAHLGVGLFVTGASVTSAFNIETDRAVTPGQRWEVAGYEIEFIGMRQVEGPNFSADEGEFELRRDGEFVANLRPQKRIYRVQTSPMTEAAIDSRLSRDLFVALGEPLGNGAWSVRVQYKPLINFIWLGAIVMAFGGLLAASDRRYRAEKRVREVAGSHSAATAGGS
jgi:cytochrome c-type biogenesis protein CcmF